MEDLSLHILDIAENSIRAHAENVKIKLAESENNDLLVLEIEDDGMGMDDETLKNATDPFYTTKQGKKFGLGLALLSQACEETGGNMRIEKAGAKGTRIIATFYKKNIDMKPIGNIAETIRVLKISYPNIFFSFEHVIENGGSM